MDDPYITALLEAAARRGVRVQVVVTRSSEWTSAFDQLAAAGVLVRTYATSTSLYIHDKVIVADAGEARSCPRLDTHITPDLRHVGRISATRLFGIAVQGFSDWSRQVLVATAPALVQ
jgi:hypothetical protein